MQKYKRFFLLLPVLVVLLLSLLGQHHPGHSQGPNGITLPPLTMWPTWDNRTPFVYITMTPRGLWQRTYLPDVRSSDVR